jgi:hypothetical protein
LNGKKFFLPAFGFDGNLKRDALPLPPFPPVRVTSKLSMYLKRNRLEMSFNKIFFERNLNIDWSKNETFFIYLKKNNLNFQKK